MLLRQIWATQRYCACPSATCDHCYPHCLNESGGLCIECMIHDEKWDRMSHEQTLGGLSLDQVRGAGGGGVTAAEVLQDQVGVSETVDPPYAHQIDFEFSLRLCPAIERHHLAPGHFFLTIEAAAEIVPRALRKQRRLEGEEEYHSTTYSLWIEERLPKGPPQAGNERRVAEAQERLKDRAERALKKEAFGRRIDEAQRAKKEKEEDEAKMKEIGIHLSEDDSPRRKVVIHAASPTIDLEEEKEHDHDHHAH
jgi:hypothetical protein